jgi:hypothetical protein
MLVNPPVDLLRSPPVRALVISVVGPVPGREDEFDEWYENTHIPEVLALDGYIAATRYKPKNALAGLPPGPTGAVTLFEVEDADHAIETLAQALPSLTTSEAADLGEASVRGYALVGSW